MEHHVIYHGNIEQRTLLIDIATRNVIRLSPGDSVAEAALIMAEKRISALVVTDEDGHPAGIVTERDIVRVYAVNPGRTDIPARNVMASPVPTIPLDNTIKEAADKMLTAGVRHLVVVDRTGRMAGLLNEHELIHAMTPGLIDDKIIAEGEFLHTLVNTIPDLVWLKDVEGVFLACNRRFELLYGVRENELIGKTDYDFMDKEPADFFRELDRKAMATEKPSVNEEWLTFAGDGYRGLFETIKTPMRDDQGKLLGVLSIARDITQRVKAEEALAESEYRYRTLVANSPLCIHEIDLTGRLQSMNKAGLDMLGLDDEKKICGVPYLSAVSDQDGGRIKALLQTAYNGFASHFEFAAAGNTPLYFKSCFIPIKDADGKVVKKLMGLTEDITERKLTEQALLESEAKQREQKEFLNSVFENALDAIMLMNSKGIITGWSKQAEQIFGWSRAEAIGRLMHETIVPFRFRKMHVQGIQRFLSTDEGPALNTRIEISALHRDGHELPVELSISPIKTADGYAFSAFIRDISERKRLEQQLAEREELFRAIFEQAPNGIELIDPDTMRFFEANPAACHMLGYTHDEYLRLSLFDTQAVLNEEALVAAVREVEASGGVAMENRHRCKNGDILDVEINARMLDLSGKRLLVGVWRDITERKRAEEALRESEIKYRQLFETAGDGIFLQDATGFIDCNEKGASMYGLSREKVIGRSPADLAPERQPDGRLSVEVAGKISAAALNGEQQQFEWRPLRADGVPFDVEITLNRIELGGSVCLQAVVRDISERKRAEENLLITASVFGNSQEAIMITDADNAIVDVNPAFVQITGYSREEVIGKNPKLLSSGRQDRAFYTAMSQSLKQKRAWRGEIWNRRKSGEMYAELLSISAICGDDGKVQRYVAVFSDISHLKEHEAELDRVAHYDALTGIPNRVLLADRMRQAIAQAAREQNMMAICYLDLDGFKSINDTLGHEAGDHVLIEVAGRIENAIRGGDTVARLGGDEFVVLLLRQGRGEECVTMLERLLAEIARPISVEDKLCTLSASIGVSFYPLDEEDPDTLLRHADQAMYVAKQSGKNRFYIYDHALDMRIRNHHEFLEKIRHGLKHNQFELYYQPKINLRTKEMVGAEALIRWRHPERGLLSPGEFLRPIENTELDVEIGEWVIATALAQINHWRQAGLDIKVSINISAYHLESPFFTEKLRQQLVLYPDIPLGALQIEMLETAALNDIALVREIIEACRKIEVGFALDDFGTGYSSLSYLRCLPVDVLKIDQSFVRGMLEDKRDMSIVHGIIALAQAFDLQTVAEGIETMEHYRALLDMGCDLGQGYGIARPMPAGELANWQAG